MNKITEGYIEKVYAGLLGKVIGVRHGAPVEGWTYDKLEEKYGEIDGYLVDYRDFAADDDTNGPMFFIRALEDHTCTLDITAEQIGLTWLNYVPYEHGFFWWGGYGKSTEHTAYLNLRNGMKAPRSGSVEQNGDAVAEQIGGQIFIDAWGLIAPGAPGVAGEYARRAASVSHGGNGIYGGMFIAACISAAFAEKDIEKIIDAGLSTIPSDCEYSRIVRAVISFYHDHPGNWRECFKYIRANFGYDRYPGSCHIIPNSAVIVLSLLYGEGSFSRTINICNMCGWDTDCNVGNTGTIMGVRNGLEGIDYGKWIKPINDFLACSSVIGSLNITDLPQAAAYIAAFGYKIAGEGPPAQWKDILEKKSARFHFELPGSTHGFRVSSDIKGILEYNICNTSEKSHSGRGALKVTANPLESGDGLRIYYKTYYRPKDFYDSRYDPCFSPLLYPGQEVSGYVMVMHDDMELSACIYVKDGNSQRYIEGERIELAAGQWKRLDLKIPCQGNSCLEEAGILLVPKKGYNNVLTAYIDDFDFRGKPDYSIDFSCERIEEWTRFHKEVSQFTWLKGIWKLEEGALSGSCCDFGEAYTGGYDWDDYSFEATIIPKTGGYHNINFRVQGAIRSYSIGLAPQNKLDLSKNDNGYKTLMQVEFPWEYRKEYSFKVEAKGDKISVRHADQKLMEYQDKENPYLFGCVGASVREGSHCHYRDFKITGI